MIYICKNYSFFIYVNVFVKNKFNSNLLNNCVGKRNDFGKFKIHNKFGIYKEIINTQ